MLLFRTPQFSRLRWWPSTGRLIFIKRAPLAGSTWLFGLEVPLWIPTAIFLAPVVVSALRLRRIRRLGASARCSTCGYDLSATPAGAPCPECGTRPTP